MIKKAKSISFLFPYIFSYDLFQPQVMITVCPMTNFGRCSPGIITWLPLIKVASRRCFVLLWEYSKKDLLKNYFRLYICFEKKKCITKGHHFVGFVLFHLKFPSSWYILEEKAKSFGYHMQILS